MKVQEEVISEWDDLQGETPDPVEDEPNFFVWGRQNRGFIRRRYYDYELSNKNLLVSSKNRF